MNSFSSGFRETAEGIATALLIIPRGIPFKRESLTEKSRNFTRIYEKAAVNAANSIKAADIDFIISPFFLFSSLRSRLASIIIMIRPNVPITGRTGLRLGMSSFVAFTINCIPIPRTMRKRTPGILEYLLVMSKV
jgi:hypothetical protein